jgi:conjugative relaxase-like TrwC/TraI family protein
MLLIYDVTSATDAKNYYASCVAAGPVDRQGYYSEGQDSPGLFGGTLGHDLGLAGKVVDKATFDRLCDNRHPSEARPLTPRTNDFRRVCKDLTFSGPKSFSILEAFASEEERQALRQTFSDSVAETFAEDIEPDMQTRERRGGADHDVGTGNALTAAYNHATARPENDDTLPDPHWHQHLLVWNATKRPDDGRIMAGQLGNIVRDKGYYEAAFYSRLADKLEHLGYGIDRRGGKEWEIAGVPQSMIEKFSKRTAQIDGEAERRGITDAATKARLGAKIRSRKQKELTMPELRKAWDASLTDAERDALAAVYRHEAASGQAVSPSAAGRFAIDHCSEQLSVVPERELKRVALLHGLGSVTPSQIAAELPRLGVLVGDFDGRRMATTEGLQREESRIVGFAAAGRGSVAPVGVPEGLERGTLNDGQWAAVTGLLQSSNRVDLLEGPAGAGKSTLLAAYDRGMRLAGRHVTYLATTTDAADVLAKDGFDVATVARFLVDPKMQAAARGGHVVIDEASMLGHKDAYRFGELAQALDVKVIYVGDPMQHGAVPRGALMRILKEYGGLRPFRLTDILRQEDSEYRAAAKLLSQGDTLAGFDALDRKGWIREVASDEERYRAIAADYLQSVKDGASCLVVSPTHREKAAIEQAIRARLRDAGKLGKEERPFSRLVAVNASAAERGVATTYRPGDVIQFHQNGKGFTKGDRLTVGDPAAVPLSEAAKFTLYRPEPIALAAGDRIRFTATVKTAGGTHTLKNGASKTVAGFDRAGNIRLDNGWVVEKAAGHFRRGFVETSFGSQGRTVQRVILGMAAASLPAMNQQQMYVSASRAKQWMRLYTDAKPDVRRAIERDSRKLAALDVKPLPAAKNAPWRRQMERKRQRTLLDRVREAWAAVKQQWQPERQVIYGR